MAGNKLTKIEFEGGYAMVYIKPTRRMRIQFDKSQMNSLMPILQAEGLDAEDIQELRDEPGKIESLMLKHLNEIDTAAQDNAYLMHGIALISIDGIETASESIDEDFVLDLDEDIATNILDFMREAYSSASTRERLENLEEILPPSLLGTALPQKDLMM